MSQLAPYASGRDADVFDLGDGTVLRRYRRRDVPSFEVEAMRYVHAHGFPVPAVFSVSGRDLVVEKVTGPTMQEAIMVDGQLEEHASALAALHHRLHELEAPAFLTRRGPGDRVLHLDLHPRNVILGPAGPCVIDWANVGAGPGIYDPALAIAIFISARAGVPPQLRGPMDVFTRSFASHFDAEELRAALPTALETRADDPNVTDAERAELRAFRWPI